MATVNREQVSRVAAYLKANPPEGSGLNFYSVQTPKGELVLDRMYPPVNHPHAVDFFFLACLHQYGFWWGDSRGYREPMYGNLGEKRLKGSDLLWGLFLRALDSEELWDPKYLADITPRQLADVMSDDEATPWPNFEERVHLTQRYGRWLASRNLNPLNIVAQANSTNSPLRGFRLIMDMDRGLNPWADDRLEKKQLLLAMALANRPERFLKVAPGEEWPPIVDYHLMRVCLRLGFVDIGSANIARNTERLWASAEEEQAIRVGTRDAVEQLIRESGLTMAQVDETLWMARKYCPETESPDCDKCLFGSVCPRWTGLFQPVIRTTAY
ncbi:MAG TPA: queuosine salvage family protein [Candidatus Paceibacterota bacterium]|nr:queuosine salvage family protein [Candidatus Paceibacterota bacterium]